MSGTRKIFKVAAVFVGLLLLAAAVLLLWGLYDAEAGADARSLANVKFTGDEGETLLGYIARPAGGSRRAAPSDESAPPDPFSVERRNFGGRPAVLMMHEWWGLTPEMIELADTLAEEGYVVLVPDAFRGDRATTFPGALFQVTFDDETRIQRDLRSAYQYLRRRPDVDATRVATIGFCFGGTQALNVGRAVTGLSGVAVFYGQGLVTAEEELGKLAQNGPVLGIFGEEDVMIPVASVKRFRSALEAGGVPHEVRVYPEVGHAFVKPDRIDGSGPAAQAWGELLRFLQRNL
jgi:carboxymethylenebutenolidase